MLTSMVAKGNVRVLLRTNLVSGTRNVPVLYKLSHFYAVWRYWASDFCTQIPQNIIVFKKSQF